jgi:hypothetical protein
MSYGQNDCVQYRIDSNGRVWVSSNVLDFQDEELIRRICRMRIESHYIGAGSPQDLNCDRLLERIARFDDHFGLDPAGRQLRRDIESQVESLREIAKRDS